MNIHRGIALTLGFLLLAGCPGGNSTPPAAAPQPAATTPPPPPIVPQKASSTPAPAAPAAAPATAPATPAAAPAAPQVLRKKAEVGVGAKGRGYGTGPIATPAATYWAARERITFDIQIAKAMQLYKALEGHAPATHEEFMEKIIKENQIKLPTLLEVERYIYDPKTETLMIERQVE